MMEPIAIELPFPPSNHEVFRRHKGKHLSERYRKWRDEAGWMLKQQRPEKVIGPVAVAIELVAPDRKRRDADNFTKGALDLLVAHGVITGDDGSVVREVTARWRESGPPCMVIVAPANTWESIGQAAARVVASLV